MDNEGCPQSLSGVHDMRFYKRDLVGTVAFNVYECRDCGELLNVEVLPWGKDSKETPPTTEA